MSERGRYLLLKISPSLRRRIFSALVGFVVRVGLTVGFSQDVKVHCSKHRRLLGLPGPLVGARPFAKFDRSPRRPPPAPAGAGAGAAEPSGPVALLPVPALARHLPPFSAVVNRPPGAPRSHDVLERDATGPAAADSSLRPYLCLRAP